MGPCNEQIQLSGDKTLGKGESPSNYPFLKNNGSEAPKGPRIHYIRMKQNVTTCYKCIWTIFILYSVHAPVSIDQGQIKSAYHKRTLCD